LAGKARKMEMAKEMETGRKMAKEGEGRGESGEMNIAEGRWKLSEKEMCS
jgi:hypothetical protein